MNTRENEEPCIRCGGTGDIGIGRCDECGGSGSVSPKHVYERSEQF